MQKISKKLIGVIIIVLLAIVADIAVFSSGKPSADNMIIDLALEFKSDHDEEIQLYYSDTMEFSEKQVSEAEYDQKGAVKNLEIPFNGDCSYLRLDLGSTSSEITISNVRLIVGAEAIDVDIESLANPVMCNCIQSVEKKENKLYIKTKDVDPWIIIKIDEEAWKSDYCSSNQLKYLICDMLLRLVVIALAVFCILKMETLVRVPLDIYRERNIFWELTKNDFQAKFAGNFLGFVWAFIQPAITILLYWFVFQVGLRVGNVSSFPFILFLLTGLIPWFYISETLSGVTGTLWEYSYLVKKIVFNVKILPVIKVVSGLFVHCFFIVILMVISCVYGYTPDIYWIQLLYYVPGMILLVTGIAYITSACAVFFKDTMQLVNVFLNAGIWITPIMWNPEIILSTGLQVLFKLNPFYYIVDGFRDIFLCKEWFWDKMGWTIYFWTFAILIYYLGIKLFDRVKNHFSDVL